MKKRLILVGPTPPPVHGVTISTQRLLNSDLKTKFNLIHLDTSDHREVHNINTIDFMNFWLAFKSYFRLIFYSFRYKPDIVYIPISQSWIGYARDAFYIVMPKLICQSRIVIHLRGSYFGVFYNNANKIVKALIDYTMPFVDRALVLGECLKPIFTRWVTPERIDVVPNGTDIQIDGVEAKLQRDDIADMTVTFMSSLMRSKGIVDFVLAAKQVLQQYPQTSFLIAGEWWNQEPELKDEVESLIGKDSATDQIRFLGLVTGDEKRRLLQKTDIFVLPTYYPFEGHPNVIVEAMAAGCPVISTNHAAIPETVIDGETGLIIPAKNPEKLAEAIMYLIENKDIFKFMARKSYERYKAFYTVEKNTELLINSFLKALSTYPS